METSSQNIIKLPQPQMELTYPLMLALQFRRSVRRWEDTLLSEQDLSNLLWAACGISKPPKGKSKSKRTAPSACNSQEIRLYVLLPHGVYLYDEAQHALIQKNDRDIREHTGTQKMMKSAPVGLVLTADLSRMTSSFLRREDAKRFSAWVDAGYVSQNIYLYCTAAGLGTVALALINREKLHQLIGLQEQEKIVITHAVGYALKDE